MRSGTCCAILIVHGRDDEDQAHRHLFRRLRTSGHDLLSLPRVGRWGRAALVGPVAEGDGPDAGGRHPSA